MRPYRLVRHRSLKALLREYLGKAAERRKKIDPHPQDPAQEPLTYREMRESLLDQGMWAFVRMVEFTALDGSALSKAEIDEAEELVPSVIHWWARPGHPIEDIAGMLGHELGHASGKTLKNEVAEEERADRYGDVAREVFRILGRRR